MQGGGSFRGSITILRNPFKRAVSGYLFRGHSPNWDRFNVRKEFPNYPSKTPKYVGGRRRDTPPHAPFKAHTS